MPRTKNHYRLDRNFRVQSIKKGKNNKIYKKLSPVIAQEFRGGHYMDRKKKLRRFQKSKKEQSGEFIKGSIKQGNDEIFCLNIIFLAQLYKISAILCISSVAI